MKKIFMMLAMVFTLTFSSCISTATVTAQTVSYYDDYFYLGVTYPVLYVNTIPYYFYGEQWILIPTTHYQYIRHYREPMRFRGYIPHEWYGHTHGYYYPHDYKRPLFHSADKQPIRPNVQSRPNIYRGPVIHQRGHNDRYNGTTHRGPLNQGSYRPQLNHRGNSNTNPRGGRR